MLLSISLKNFHSFAERTLLSLTLNRRDQVHGWDRVSPSGVRLSTAMALLGANAAGKSNLLKVGPFLAYFVRDSFSLPANEVVPFMPHQAHRSEPAEFVLVSDDDEGVTWRYELRLTPGRVLHEALYRKGVAAGDRFRYVFERTDEGSGYAVRQQGFGLAESEAAKVRPNVSLISWARQYGTEMALKVSDFFVSTNVIATGRVGRAASDLSEAAAFFSESAPLQDRMKALLKNWDLGLADVHLDRFEQLAPDGTATKLWYPMGLHESAGSTFTLPFALESSGTQTAFLLLWRLLPALEAGGVAFIDELESDLHPHMIEPILRLFHDPETNPRGAQIIFTCQAPEVLKLLQKAQVTFVEKSDCASTAYRGDEVAGLTSQHNFYTKYMTGALGAVPQL